MSQDDFNKGCCGHPPSCQQTGRCKAREEYLERKANGRRTMDDVFWENRSPEQIRDIQEITRRRSARENRRDRGERTLSL